MTLITVLLILLTVLVFLVTIFLKKVILLLMIGLCGAGAVLRAVVNLAMTLLILVILFLMTVILLFKTVVTLLMIGVTVSLPVDGSTGATSSSSGALVTGAEMIVVM